MLRTSSRQLYSPTGKGTHNLPILLLYSPSKQKLILVPTESAQDVSLPTKAHKSILPYHEFQKGPLSLRSSTESILIETVSTTKRHTYLIYPCFVAVMVAIPEG